MEEYDYFSRALSDEILLIILNFLPFQEKVNLFRTCRRFQRLCLEPKLWKDIEIPPDFLSSDVVHLTVSKLTSAVTKSVKLSSLIHPTNKAFRPALSLSHFHLLNRSATKLRELYLIRQKLDGRFLKFNNLPSSLKLLHLTGTLIQNVTETTFYFQDICKHLEELEDFDLSECSWVTSHALMAISKLPNLVKLRLRGVRAIGNCLAYASLASRFGFQNLKYLDLTDSSVGGSDFIAFASISSLEELYVGQYDQGDIRASDIIEDLCFIRLDRNSPLKMLDISGSQITDTGLTFLRTIPFLEGVIAHYTDLSERAIEEFHDMKPTCKIIKTRNPVVDLERIQAQRVNIPEARLDPYPGGIVEIFIDRQNGIAIHRR